MTYELNHWGTQSMINDTLEKLRDYALECAKDPFHKTEFNEIADRLEAIMAMPDFYKKVDRDFIVPASWKHSGHWPAYTIPLVRVK